MFFRKNHDQYELSVAAPQSEINMTSSVYFCKGANSAKSQVHLYPQSIKVYAHTKGTEKERMDAALDDFVHCYTTFVHCAQSILDGRINPFSDHIERTWKFKEFRKGYLWQASQIIGKFSYQMPVCQNEFFDVPGQDGTSAIFNRRGHIIGSVTSINYAFGFRLLLGASSLRTALWAADGHREGSKEKITDMLAVGLSIFFREYMDYVRLAPRDYGGSAFNLNATSGS